jgi:PBSX family phage terminase large subunit
MPTINITDVIGGAYYEMFHDMEQRKHLHYWMKGGRGSLKSSYSDIYTIIKLTEDALNGKVRHAVAMRKVKETIKDSIFADLLWAISILGLSEYWHHTLNPMRMWFKDNEILFRGAANKRDYEKIKSIKFKKGYCKFALYEELTEFNGMDEIMSINQSLFRGGDEAIAMYRYNPPASKNNWVNKESKIDLPNRYIHHSTYLDAPREWLGEVFIQEAEQLKVINLRKYNHMYMGEEIGEGLEIYPNVKLRTITDEEIFQMTKLSRGIDFGFTRDASQYIEVFYDEKNHRLFILDEVYGHRLTNDMLADKIKPKSGIFLIRGDSAEPRTINELNLKGLNIRGAIKGKDSMPHGIKWLSELNEIIIDKKRTPHAAEDMETYEYEKDIKTGDLIYDYPKEPHTSAATRYALNDIIRKQIITWGGKK